MGFSGLFWRRRDQPENQESFYYLLVLKKPQRAQSIQRKSCTALSDSNSSQLHPYFILGMVLMHMKMKMNTIIACHYENFIYMSM